MPEHAEEDLSEFGIESHKNRCCDCFDAIVAGEPKFCAKCAEMVS